MSRAPLLTKRVIDSIEVLLSDMPPAAFLGSDKEAGVKYLHALIKHQRDPSTKVKRQKEARRVSAARKG